MNDKLIQSIIDRDNCKRDEVAPARSIVYGRGGFLFDGRPINATDTAVKQLLGTCGIPADFFNNRMNTNERISVFNRLNLEQSETERMFRFHGDCLYGVVSPKYKKLDNIRILDVLQAASDSGIGLKPVKWTLSHDHTRVTLVPKRASVGELTPSITVTNSENGLASMSLWAGVYRWVCTNGMMIPISDVTKSRWMHLGNTDITLPDIRTVLNKSFEYTERLYEAKSRYLSSEEKSGIVLKIADKLGQRVAEKVVDVANRQYHGGRTLFDAVNAITRTAQSFRPQQQTEIERYASTLLAA